MKPFLVKVTLQIGQKKFSLLRKLKILHRGLMLMILILLIILTVKKLLECFLEGIAKSKSNSLELNGNKEKR